MTKTLTATLALVAALAAAAAAQTLVATIDLAALGYSQAVVRTVEADGNPATLELLAIRNSDGLYSVARGSCAGPWFNPRAGLPVSVFAAVTVNRVGAVDLLMVRDVNGSPAYGVSLNAPNCY